MGDGSDMKPFTSGIKDVRKVDDLTVEIETAEPYPILPDVLSEVYMMSHKWCEANKAERPVDKRKGIENAASFKANGTGPYMLKRAASPTCAACSSATRTSGGAQADGNVQEVVYTPIRNRSRRAWRRCCRTRSTSCSTRRRCSDVERLRAEPAHPGRATAPRTASIFIGMDQARDELQVLERQGPQPVQGPARAQGAVRGDRHRADPHQA
jgi:peptide/nickel transport system substrate-binding protein